MNKERSSFFDITRTESMKKALGKYLKKSGVGWMLKHREIVDVWNKSVGEDIARLTQVTGFKGGVLHVDIFSAALKAEFEQFGSDTLVRTLRRTMGTELIRQVRFHLSAPPEELLPPDRDDDGEEKEEF